MSVLTYSIPPMEGYNQSIIARSVRKYPVDTCHIIKYKLIHRMKKVRKELK